MNCEFAPTINEIVMHRQDRELNWMSDLIYSSGRKFNVGDIVEFAFNRLKKVGRITNVIRRNGKTLYNIETKTHQWFQKINQEDILSKID